MRFQVSFRNERRLGGFLSQTPTISCHTRLSSNTSSDDDNISTGESLLQTRILGEIPSDLGSCINVH